MRKLQLTYALLLLLISIACTVTTFYLVTIHRIPGAKPLNTPAITMIFIVCGLGMLSAILMLNWLLEEWQIERKARHLANQHRILRDSPLDKPVFLAW